MMQFEKLIVSSDHAGFEMKEHIKTELVRLGVSFDDAGTSDTQSTDYPLWSARVASAVSSGKYPGGITICGAGIGASIAANRFRGVRAALCVTEEMARLSREHNNSNVLVLGGRITSLETASAILATWLTTSFMGGRHEKRVKLLDEVAGSRTEQIF